MLSNSYLHNKHNGFIRQHRSFALALVKIVDILIIVLLFFACLDISDGRIDKEKGIVLLSSILGFKFFATVNSLYGIPRGARFLFIIKNTLTAWLGAAFTVSAVVGFFLQFDEDEKHKILAWVLLTPCLIILWHLTLRVILSFCRKIGRNSRITVIAGATTLGLDIENIIKKQPWMGLSFLGYFDDRYGQDENRHSDVDLLGNFNDMIEMARANKIDVIFITLPMAAELRIRGILDDLSDTSATVYFIPDLFIFNLLGAKIENFNGLPTVCVYDTPHGSVDGFSKRMFDIVFSLIILLIISVPMLIISVGVKLSSPGPVFFIQRRYGFRGEEIKVWKFRTMRVCEDGENINQATQGDPRITKFGQFLRRTSLDELPQFINTLQGRMSIVGPRPHAVAHNEFYRGQIKGYMLRHNVKPGITGLAQIRGFRGETDTLDKMEGRIHSDLEYIQRWSIWMDFEILLQTIFKGFAHKNAY